MEEYNNEYSREEALDFLKEHCIFDNEKDVYVMLGVSRNKLNKNNDGKQKRIPKVITKAEKIEDIYDSMVNHLSLSGQNFYIYVSVNPRDAKKAARELTMKLVDILSSDHITYLKSLDAKWVSFLMKPESRSGRGKFMIDIDTTSYDTVLNIENILNTVDYKLRKTPNGYHMVTNPFNPVLINTVLDADVKKDDLIFVNSFIK